MWGAKMDVGHLLIILRIITPILLCLATVFLLQVFTNFNWMICAFFGILAALSDVLIIMPYTEKSVQKSLE